MMSDLMVYFQNMFVVFCLIPVVFQYALRNPLFFLFTADVSHDTEEYGIHHESKYCKQYKHCLLYTSGDGEYVLAEVNAFPGMPGRKMMDAYASVIDDFMEGQA